MATPTRRNALKLLFSAPAFLMLGVAVQSKPNYVDYDNMVSSTEADARITKYIEPVRKAEQLALGNRRDAQSVRAVADYWVAEAKAGNLEPIPPQAVDDTLQTGVKSQIYSAAREISFLLRKTSLEASKRGEYDLAARDLLTSLQLVEPLRYSDITSVAMIGNHQRRILKDLRTIWPNVSAQARASAKPILAEMAPDAKEMEDVLRTERRLTVIDIAQTAEIDNARNEPLEGELDEPRDSSLLIRVATTNEQENGKLIQKLIG